MDPATLALVLLVHPAPQDHLELPVPSTESLGTKTSAGIFQPLKERKESEEQPGGWKCPV